jgi:hypothetical protein
MLLYRLYRGRREGGGWGNSIESGISKCILRVSQDLPPRILKYMFHIPYSIPNTDLKYSPPGGGAEMDGRSLPDASAYRTGALFWRAGGSGDSLLSIRSMSLCSSTMKKISTELYCTSYGKLRGLDGESELLYEPVGNWTGCVRTARRLHWP